LEGSNKPDKYNPVLLFPATGLPACLSAIMSGRRSVVGNPFSLCYAAAEMGFGVIAASYKFRHDLIHDGFILTCYACLPCPTAGGRQAGVSSQQNFNKEFIQQTDIFLLK